MNVFMNDLESFSVDFQDQIFEALAESRNSLEVLAENLDRESDV
jgi:hypothetical protein